MIINCINCNKKFKVNSELIPAEGRTIQCGSCNHIWFFIKKKIDKNEVSETVKTYIPIPKDIIGTKVSKPIKTQINTPIKQISKVDKNFDENKFSFATFLALILVGIISFIALIVIIDTFRTPLYSVFPDLELLLFSLFELLKDIKLFIKDLI
jgi:predicted Zn finger-like uncharacterized protein